MRLYLPSRWLAYPSASSVSSRRRAVARLSPAALATSAIVSTGRAAEKQLMIFSPRLKAVT